MNPYESRPIASSVTPNRLSIFAVFAWAIYTLTSIAVILLASLPISYPGLSDKASGPAHYWPDDAFHILLPVAACLMAVSTFVFCIRRTAVHAISRTKTQKSVANFTANRNGDS